MKGARCSSSCKSNFLCCRIVCPRVRCFSSGKRRLFPGSRGRFGSISGVRLRIRGLRFGLTRQDFLGASSLPEGQLTNTNFLFCGMPCSSIAGGCTSSAKCAMSCSGARDGSSVILGGSKGAYAACHSLRASRGKVLRLPRSFRGKQC